MRFLAAHWLWLLVAVAALAGAYVWVQVRGRKQAAVRFTNLALLASVAPRRPGWRRHLAAGLLLASLVAMVVALARPVRDIRIPRPSTVVLAVDVSVSMRATDVEPSRLEAAARAGERFVSDLPEQVRLGLVTFAGTARVAVEPTSDHDRVVEGLRELELAEATAIGDAVITSLQAVGGEAPATIVLLSDGTTTVGTPDDVAAQLAADAGIPVTTIAFGTDAGRVTYNGQTIPVPVGRAALAALAETTGGRAFEAADADELDEVYDDIESAVGYRPGRREVTTGVLALAVALGLVAAAASLRWSARLP